MKKENLVWKTTEIRYLAKEHGKKSYVQIAIAMGRSYDSVRWKAYAMGLRTDKRMPWTTKELCYVQTHYRDQSISEIARALGRGYDATKGFIYRLRSRDDHTTYSIKHSNTSS